MLFFGIPCPSGAAFQGHFFRVLHKMKKHNIQSSGNDLFFAATVDHCSLLSLSLWAIFQATIHQKKECGLRYLNPWGILQHNAIQYKLIKCNRIWFKYTKKERDKPHFPISVTFHSSNLQAHQKMQLFHPLESFEGNRSLFIFIYLHNLCFNHSAFIRTTKVANKLKVKIIKTYVLNTI